MASKTKTKNGIHRLPLEGEMTIYNAAEMKARLIEAIDNHKELEIDLARITEMDSAGFQLLLLAKREAGNQKKSLRLSNHSEACLELINLYHTAEFFGDPIILKRKGK